MKYLNGVSSNHRSQQQEEYSNEVKKVTEKKKTAKDDARSLYHGIMEKDKIAEIVASPQLHEGKNRMSKEVNVFERNACCRNQDIETLGKPFRNPAPP
jgi:hypothetical protein